MRDTHPCRFPFQHDADSCDCRPSKMDFQIDRFAASAELRKIISRRDRANLAFVYAVAFIAALGFLYAANEGLGRAEHQFQMDARR